MVCLDRYIITKDGHIFDKKRNNIEIKTHLSDGYKMCCIYDENKIKHVLLVHRIIAQKYLDNYTDDCHVHHIDGNKTNNDVNNLVCMTSKEHLRKHKVKYEDKIKVCPVCKKEFLWTAAQQRSFKHRSTYGPFCSSSCAIRYITMFKKK